MMSLELIITVLMFILTPVITFLGFTVRRIIMRLDKTLPSDEVRTLIDDKLSPVVVELRYIKSDLDKQNRLQIQALDVQQQTLKVLEQIRIDQAKSNDGK